MKKQFSNDLIAAIKSNAASINEGFVGFCQNYETAFVELGGADWRKDETNMAYLFAQVSRRLKPFYIEAGMKPAQFTHYSDVARGYLMVGTVWNTLGRVSLATAKKALELASADTTGSWQERIERAVTLIRAKTAAKQAEQRVANNGGVALPSAGEDSPDDYRRRYLSRLESHITNLPANYRKKLRPLLAVVQAMRAEDGVPVVEFELDDEAAILAYGVA